MSKIMNDDWKVLLLDNSELPVKFMYPSEYASDDYPYTMGTLKNIAVSHIWEDDERVWVLEEDEEELLVYLENEYNYDEDSVQVGLDEIEWNKVILIYIGQ